VHRYKYKVCKGRKVLALSTTLHEAEAEARRVGGRVLPLENVLGKSSASPSEHVAQTSTLASTLETKPKNPQAKKSQRLSRTQQKKYLGDLKGEDREARAAEILYRREHRSNKPFVTDKGQTTKHSTHAAAFAKRYGRPPKDTADAAKLAGVPKKVLDEVYARGMAAWQTGHRPGASQHGWAMARIESFLTGGPTSRTADADLAAKVQNPAGQTETPEFKRWFGDSKVVDAKGKPLVVYHGTKAQFTAFDKRYVRDQLGFHFGTKGQAKRAPSGKGKGSHVDAYWLSIQNPLRVRDEGSWTTEAAVDAINRATGLRIRYGARDAEIVRALQAAGYDGIVYANRFEYGEDKDFGKDSWIAFEPTQIKSATDNRGTFDPHDADIRNPERTFIPPPAVAAEARMALDLRAAQPHSNKCCTPVGIARAKQLANRQPVSETTLRRMKAYFDRHAVDSKGKGWKVDSKGWQAWLAWGGDSGREWCEKLLRGL